MLYFWGSFNFQKGPTFEIGSSAFIFWQFRV
jgi:hypothetical protein